MIKINDNFKNLIPALTPDEFEQLQKNCIKEGILESIKTWNGFIIDGHNRYEIATKHGLKYEIKEMQFESENHVIEWIILHQFGRRNLPNYERAKLALRLKDLFAEKAKENLIKAAETTNNKLHQTPCQNSDKPLKVESIDTKKELAKIAGVSHDTIHKVETIENKATPEIKAKLQTQEYSINQAYNEIKKEEKIQQIAEKKAIENKILLEIKEVNNYDFIKNISILEAENFIPENIKVLLTDPPYGQNFVSNRRVISEKDKGITNDNNIDEALQLLDNSLKLIYPKMQENSFAFIFTSWRFEPEFRIIFEKYFTLKNSLIWVKNNHGSGDLTGTFAPKHERILFGTKGNPKLNYRISDVLNGSEIVTTHSTSKPIDLLQELIKVSSNENDIIFEPFAGHGSTIISSINLKRKIYATEIDKENYTNILNNLNLRYATK
jgi:DNA modification methylase/DNA-binding XRE family transcriptional regulator